MPDAPEPSKRKTTPTVTPDAPTELATVDVHRRMRSIRLRIESGPDAGRELEFSPRDDDARDPVPGRRITGGRNKVNDIVLTSTKVSGSHFELRLEKDGVRLRDLDSSNGTFIGPVRVTEALLVPGTVFSPAGCCDIRLVDATKAEVSIHGQARFGPMLGASPVMREIFLAIQRLANTPLTVLIEGETGTGKELVAREIHAHSSRAKAELVTLDCTNLPRDMAEGMILGHSKGAFTGAISDYAGIFEQAHGGTLFLDEIGELPLELQPKLLRVLERGEVQRLGSRETRKIDVRFIAATHRDLRAMVADGRFREDLYYRIATASIRLPSLRERGNDVIDLAQEFLDDACRKQGGKQLVLSGEIRNWLKKAQWPGNVRPLRNVITTVAYLGTGVITEGDLAKHWKEGHFRGPDPLLELPLADALLCFKHRYVQHLLNQTGGNVSEASRRSGYSRGQLNNIINDYRERFPSGGAGERTA